VKIPVPIIWFIIIEEHWTKPKDLLGTRVDSVHAELILVSSPSLCRRSLEDLGNSGPTPVGFSAELDATRSCSCPLGWRVLDRRAALPIWGDRNSLLSTFSGSVCKFPAMFDELVVGFDGVILLEHIVFEAHTSNSSMVDIGGE
jgi:hypothetical protein